nr:primosomal protein N' [Candidatus Enterousia merdequi]
MFQNGDIVKVLIPNVINNGYDYRLVMDADIGDFVRVSVMNRQYIGVIVGKGDSNLEISKIKPVLEKFDFGRMSKADIDWIYKMSAWTLMAPGAVLRLILNVTDAFGAPKTEQLYTFNFDSNIKMTNARQSVADAFQSNENEAMSVNDIMNIAHVGNAVVKGLIKNASLIPSETREKESENFIYEYRDMGNVVLNKEQQMAADVLKSAIEKNEFSVHLLDGITGSGKTQVYFDAALQAYNRGKSVLLMMPEIALTAQFMERFKQRFGEMPVVWHSNLTASRRRRIWRGVATGDIKIIVGTRSALFLPWQSLGLIVVDEEHDTSYKQEDMGNYHARDMAVLRAKIANFPIVLASATPSVETLYNVSLGKYKRLRLTSRFGGAQMPTIETIDMRNSRPESYKIKEEEKNGNLSPILCEEMQSTLDNHKQIMLFINRRGFAPIIQCKKCGWVGECPDCSCGLNYHKHLNKMVCHLCGKIMPLPNKCPKCGNDVSMRGAGLERIEEEISVKFPNAKTALVSSDTITSRESLERLVKKMETGEIDIVIGTQILAKGHHFPNLTLVGVVDADMGLFGTDFRAGEHTFQQLFQVAGRAGRGEFPGRVLLQTYQTENPVIRAICAGNRDEFMGSDMESRRSAKMPPFGQLIAVIVEADKEKTLKKYCDDLANIAPKLNGGKIMGPIAAQIYQIRNWYRMRFLVSGDEHANLQPIVKNWLGKIKTPVNVRVKIDVNPQNFM